MDVGMLEEAMEGGILEEEMEDGILEAAMARFVGARFLNSPRIVVKDGKRMEVVSQECIDSIKLIPPRPPLSRYSEDFFRSMGLDDAEIKVMLDAYQAAQEIRDIQADILEQYNATGYAYIPLPEGYVADGGEAEEARV